MGLQHTVDSDLNSELAWRVAKESTMDVHGQSKLAHLDSL